MIRKVMGLIAILVILMCMGCNGPQLTQPDEQSRYKIYITDFAQQQGTSAMYYHGIIGRNICLATTNYNTSTTYYPLDSKKIYFYGNSYEILEVTSEYIVVRYLHAGRVPPPPTQ